MKIGIIGRGIMGTRMLHALEGRSDLVAGPIWDARPELRTTDSVANLIDRSDVVYIATPPSTHLQYVRMADDAGKPVFCEKPLAVDLEDARRIVRDIRVKNAVNFPFASSAAVETLERLLKAESPRRVDIQLCFSQWPREWQKGAASWLAGPHEGGFLREVFSHFAYLTLRLIGPIVVRDVRIADGPLGSEADVLVRMESGNVPIDLVGKVDARIPDSIEWTAFTERHHYRLRDWTLLESDSGEFAPDRPPKPKLQDQLDSVVKWLRGEPHPLPDFRAGLDVMTVVEEIHSRR